MDKKHENISEDVMIEINHLSKVYHLYDKPIDRLKEALSFTHKCYHKEHYALHDLNLKISKGESVGIVGVNGSGKSTLLKIITGVLNPSDGEVKTNGKIAALLELGAGFNPEYTGIENIYLNGTMMGYTEAEMKERVQAIVEFADIGEFVNQPVKTYSSGMFARLAFAVSINVDPEILIVDEALSVGDTRFQVKCIDKMKELKNNGTTILFVSHAIEQIKRFCNRAIWIKKGEIVEDGEASQVVDLYDNYMKFGEKILEENQEVSVSDEKADFEVPMDKSILASIYNVKINKTMFKTFEKLEVSIIYDIYEEVIQGFLLGVAIYSRDRKDYIFGPNTHLDKKEIPNTKGRHKIKYTIPSLSLMNGDYAIDVGIFNNEGIVNFDYKMSAKEFAIANTYFSEGKVYLEHEWSIENLEEEGKDDRI